MFILEFSIVHIRHNKMKNKKSHTVGTVPKCNRKFLEKKIDTRNTQMQDCSLSWLRTVIPIKSSGVKPVLWAQELFLASFVQIGILVFNDVLSCELKTSFQYYYI